MMKLVMTMMMLMKLMVIDGVAVGDNGSCFKDGGDGCGSDGTC